MVTLSVPPFTGTFIYSEMATSLTYVYKVVVVEGLLEDPNDWPEIHYMDKPLLFTSLEKAEAYVDKISAYSAYEFIRENVSEAAARSYCDEQGKLVPARVLQRMEKDDEFSISLPGLGYDIQPVLLDPPGSPRSSKERHKKWY